jgi:hypothetical protein
VPQQLDGITDITSRINTKFAGHGCLLVCHPERSENLCN